MSQEQRSALALLSFEKNLGEILNFNEVMNNFANDKAHRKTF